MTGLPCLAALDRMCLTTAAGKSTATASGMTVNKKAYTTDTRCDCSMNCAGCGQLGCAGTNPGSQDATGVCVLGPDRRQLFLRHDHSQAEAGQVLIGVVKTNPDQILSGYCWREIHDRLSPGIHVRLQGLALEILDIEVHVTGICIARGNE